MVAHIEGRISVRNRLVRRGPGRREEIAREIQRATPFCLAREHLSCARHSFKISRAAAVLMER